MTEDEIKFEQNEQHIKCLQGKNAEIQARIEKAKEPKWIAATNQGDRLLLHLAGLT